MSRSIAFLSAVAISNFLIATAVAQTLSTGASRTISDVQPAAWLGGGCSSCDTKGKADDCDSCKSAKGKGGKEAIGEGLAEPEMAEPSPAPFDFLAGTPGAFSGARSAAPGMIGDFFGTGYRMRLGSIGQDYGYFPYGNFDQGTSIAVAAGDRRFKISDNNSPFPVDRIFFNYHHFENALVTADGRDASLDRAMFGIEKTFRDGLWSAEVRLPFASGLSSDQSTAPNRDNLATEFGNVGFALKRLLHQSDTWTTSVGLGVVTPTADETAVYGQNGALFLTIENEAFYLQPFAGILWTPNDRLFAQFFWQADFDANGNSVNVVDGPSFILQDQTLMFVDFSVGYWLFRDPCRDGAITGFAPMIELHHTTTLEDPDFIDINNNGEDIITNFANRQDALNMTGGLRFELFGHSYLTVAGVAPLSTEDNKLFDAEFNLEFVRLY